MTEDNQHGTSPTEEVLAIEYAEAERICNFLKRSCPMGYAAISKEIGRTIGKEQRTLKLASLATDAIVVELRQYFDGASDSELREELRFGFGTTNEGVFTVDPDRALERMRSIRRTQHNVLTKVANEARRKEQERMNAARDKNYVKQREQNEQRQIQEYLEARHLPPSVLQFKNEKDAILSYLRANHVECFYHFTARKNLSLIASYGGLYSWFHIQKYHHVPPTLGGNSYSRKLDLDNGVADYVHLSFCEDHPMKYRLEQATHLEYVLLKIDLNVATLKPTCFTDKNAASSNLRKGDSLNDLMELVNIPATQKKYLSREDPDFAAHQAEVLVLKFLPLEYILNWNEVKDLK